MEVFNIISGVCSIFGLLISGFTLNEAKKIYNEITDNSRTETEINGNSMGNNSKIAGRDINEHNKK